MATAAIMPILATLDCFANRSRGTTVAEDLRGGRRAHRLLPDRQRCSPRAGAIEIHSRRRTARRFHWHSISTCAISRHSGTQSAKSEARYAPDWCAQSEFRLTRTEVLDSASHERRCEQDGRVAAKSLRMVPFRSMPWYHPARTRYPPRSSPSAHFGPSRPVRTTGSQCPCHVCRHPAGSRRGHAGECRIRRHHVIDLTEGR